MSNKRRAPTVTKSPTNDDIPATQPLIGGQQKQKQVSRYDTSSVQVEQSVQQEKAEDILALERDLRDAQDVMQMFNGMVKEQQGGLDDITRNTGQATQNVISGTDELKEAQRLQKKARKKQCCLFAILVVVVGLIVIVVWVMK